MEKSLNDFIKVNIERLVHFFVTFSANLFLL